MNKKKLLSLLRECKEAGVVKHGCGLCNMLKVEGINRDNLNLFTPSENDIDGLSLGKPRMYWADGGKKYNSFGGLRETILCFLIAME